MIRLFWGKYWITIIKVAGLLCKLLRNVCFSKLYFFPGLRKVQRLFEVALLHVTSVHLGRCGLRGYTHPG